MFRKSFHNEGLYWLLLFLLFAKSHQRIEDCPNEWELFGQSCYKFVFYPSRIFDDAKLDCKMFGAGLVSVNDLQEQKYLTDWIKRVDAQRNLWYTSGVEVPNVGFRWEGDGGTVPDDLLYWLSEGDRHRTGEIVLYRWKDLEVGWSRGSRYTELPYICEIPQTEAYRIIEENRDFDYGTNITDPNNFLRGPTFTVEARDIVIVVQKQDMAAVECVAFANPPAQYGWSKVVGKEVIDITPEYNPRYVLTNGRLTLDQPEDGTDSGRYQCRAENQFGLIQGSVIQISFGSIGEFSNVPREAVRAYEYYGAAIECIPPRHKPALSYQWYKDKAGDFVRPEFQPYMFISSLGKLYFSEVTRVDEGAYFCIATLTTTYGSGEIEITPSRTSMPTRLQIIDGTAREWGPDIHDDFIAVFPPNPQRGQLLRMECFAYGTTPMYYSWTREGHSIPDKAMFRDSNRVLYIPDVQLEDSGVYRCSCRRTTTATASKTINLVIAAKPYFIFPLRPKHVDIGGQITWRCGARAIPNPTYSWYKNGELMKPVSGEIDISYNVLTIRNLEPSRHDGMYQCLATNLYGTSVSSAQLRVLAIVPNFSKWPLETQQLAAIGGNATYRCEPEAAPFPEIKWFKNGVDLGLRPGETTGRLQLLSNGHLLLTQIQQSDAGRYRCTATNIMGTASSEGQLVVLSGTTISRGPTSVSVQTNDTAFLFCQASYNPTYDMVYQWTFNGRLIDIDRDPYYGWGSGVNPGGLYIRFARFRHAGDYECLARTVADEARAKATVVVTGPPGPPAGVFVEGRSSTPYSMKVRWTTGFDNGRPILYYLIQAQTVYNMEWNNVSPNIPNSQTIQQGEDLRRYTVTGLRPGNGYIFRIAAIHGLGQGLWSLNSDVYHTPGAPPSVAPQNIRASPGRVGLFTAIWDGLDQSEHNGEGMGYNIYWRRKGANLQTWSKRSSRGNSTFFATTVGVNNYYLEYEIQVQAFNNHGNGPNSSIAVLFSSEGLPAGMPTGVYCDPYNSTAIKVYWNPVPDNRDFMRGTILGYQVNYYIADIDDPILYANTYLGNGTSGIIVGLYPNTFYWSGVQVYNTAGLGPESETDLEQTYADAPRLYPTEVFVHSVNGERIRVKFRGISTNIGEEPLLGYKLRYWLFNDDIRGARDIFLGKTADGEINGLEKGYIYELRVLGYSNGGDGKMSPSVYFTLEGGQVRIDPGTSEIIAGGSSLFLDIPATFIIIVFSLIITYL